MPNNPNLKKYFLNYDDKVDIVFEIDHNIATEDFFQLLNNLLSGNEERLDKNGSAFEGVMKLIGIEILSLTIKYHLNTAAVISSLNDGSAHEFFPKMDGTFGIKIISIDNFEFEEDDFTLTEML